MKKSVSLLFFFLLQPALAVEEEELFLDDPFAEDLAVLPPDPLEPINRATFQLNDLLYCRLLKPLAQGYASLPGDLRQDLGEVLGNWRGLLQVRTAASETVRFLVCLLAGDDCPTRSGEGGMELLLTDLGVPGSYLVLPVSGSSNLRLEVARLLSYLFLPSRLPAAADAPESEGAAGLARQIAAYESLKKGSLDPYACLRSVYQQRQAQTRGQGIDFAPLTASGTGHDSA